jgi:hypothetical protein
MKVNCFKLLAIFSLVLFAQLCFSQTDNGNHFVKTWQADKSVFQGGWGEIGLYAEEGLDLDKDGKKEFIVYDHYIAFQKWDRLQVWEAKGDNDFYLAWEVKYMDTATQKEQGHGLTVSDIDFDGNKEVWIATEAKLYAYEADGTTFESGGGLPKKPTQSLLTIQDNSGAANIRQLKIANMDSDPDLEIFMGYTFQNGLYCVIGSLPGSTLSSPDWKLEYADDFSPWKVGGVNINDFDGDGKIEVFTINQQDESITRLYESNGADIYDIKYTTSQGTLTLNPLFDDAIADPVFYDFNGDGKKELVIGDIHGKVFIITYDASKGFTDFGSSAWTFLLRLPGVAENGFVRSGIAADLDQDGKMDVYYNDMTAKAVLDLEYQGGPVTDPASWTATQIYTGHKLVLGYISPAGDLDGDGKKELVIAANGEANGNLQVIENTDVTSIKENRPAVAEDFQLLQNYPNPFNSGTTFKYNLQKSAHVSLKIYNIHGQEIETLANEVQGIGAHQTTWQAKGLSSGMYLCKLQADDFSQIRKLVYQQ